MAFSRAAAASSAASVPAYVHARRGLDGRAVAHTSVSQPNVTIPWRASTAALAGSSGPVWFPSTKVIVDRARS